MQYPKRAGRRAGRGGVGCPTARSSPSNARSRWASRSTTPCAPSCAAAPSAPARPCRKCQLAEQLGVSRTPVREAMARLASEGLLASDRRSFTVPALSLQDVDDIYEVRFLVEPAALRRIAAADGRSAARRRAIDTALADAVAAHRGRRQRRLSRRQRALPGGLAGAAAQRPAGARGRAVRRSPAAHPRADARRRRRAHRRAARPQAHHRGAGRGRRRRRRGGDARTPAAGAPRLHPGHRAGRQARGRKQRTTNPEVA